MGVAKTPAFFAAVALVYLAMPLPAHAFCLENGSEERVLTVIEVQPAEAGDTGPALRRWLDPGRSICCTPGDADCGLSFSWESSLLAYVFADETVLEGCSESVSATSRSRLIAFEAFDRCTWQIEEIRDR